MWQLNILVSIVNFEVHHAATQYPGHGTKIVTLPLPLLLCWIGLYVFDSMLL